MADNKKIKKEDGLLEVENMLTKSEQFIETNQKIISIVLGSAVVIVVGFFSLNKFYFQPREKTAKEQMFMAENYFEKDSFNVAINGDGNYLGFLDVIDKYGSTKAGNLACYYTGISYLRMGKYQEALDYLDKFSTDDFLVAPVAEGAKGDAYAELGQTEKALSAYKKAYEMSDNELTAPVYMMKAGNLLEGTKTQDALAIYEQLKKKYPNSTEGRLVDKYIARINLASGK